MGGDPDCTGGKTASGEKQGWGAAALQTLVCGSAEESLSVITPQDRAHMDHILLDVSLLLFLLGGGT